MAAAVLGRRNGGTNEHALHEDGEGNKVQTSHLPDEKSRLSEYDVDMLMMDG